MKFWQLSVIMGRETSHLDAVLKQPRWIEYYQWHQNLDQLCEAFDRSKLDAILPEDLVREALGRSEVRAKARDHALALLIGALS